MKKGFLILLILIFIFVGIYGTSYFLKLKRAEQKLNDALLLISEGNHKSAIEKLKEIIASSEYPIVKAAATYILGDAYERNQEYTKSIETHQSLISDPRLTEKGKWHVQSVLSLSRMYRQGVSSVTPQKTELLHNYLESLIDTVKEEKVREQSGQSLEEELKDIVDYLLKQSFSLSIQDLSYDELLVSLQTELGLLLLQEKEYERAESILSRLDAPLARFGLARLYLETGQERKGISLLEDLLQYDNTGKIKSYYITAVFYYAENLYSNKDYLEAVPLFMKIIEREKDTEYSESSLYYVAMYHYRSKTYTDSIKYIDRILSNAVLTKDEEAHLLKGYIYYDRRDFIQALKVFHNFLSKYPYSERAKTAYEWKAMCERSLKYLG